VMLFWPIVNEARLCSMWAIKNSGLQADGILPAYSWARTSLRSSIHT
jgi:hypothetical protein